MMGKYETMIITSYDSYVGILLQNGVEVYRSLSHDNKSGAERDVQEHLEELSQSQSEFASEIKQMMSKELEAANTKFPMFNSSHEEWAVIMEEIEEAQQHFSEIEVMAANIWSNTKANNIEATYAYAMRIKNEAIKLIEETIQLGAIAQKYLDSLKGIGE